MSQLRQDIELAVEDALFELIPEDKLSKEIDLMEVAYEVAYDVRQVIGEAVF